MRMRASGIVAALVAAGVAFTPGVASAEVGARVAATSSGHFSGSVFAAWNWSHGGSGSSLNAVGLAESGTKLVKFSVNRPEKAAAIGAVTGLQGDTALVGIDYRVQNGKLYGVGNSGGLYVISDKDATAAKVGQLSVALSGTAFGVDFNPAANALRIVSDTGQNLRQPFGEGDAPTVATVADTALTNAGAAAVGISAAAYTNNDLSAETGTSLFDLDTTADQIVLQSPANAGTVVATGKLGVAADLDAGLDIYSKVRNSRTVEVTAFATIGQGGTYKLYSVDVLTGIADSEGTFKFPVTDIAIPLAQR